MKFGIREFYKELLSHVNFHLDKTILVTTLRDNLHALLYTRYMIM
jgi:hypothetical protein